jgi:hypothetical protein
VYIDLQVNINTQPAKTNTVNRNLTSTNHKAVKKFIQAITETTTTTELLHELLELELKATWSEEDHDKLENIDQQLTTLLVLTEKQLKSPYNNPWSPQLHEKYEIHRYWQIQKMRKNNKIRNTPTLRLLETKYLEKLHQGNPTRSIYGQFYISKKHLQEARTQARQLRNEHLLSSYMNAQAMSDETKMKILKSIRNKESKEECYRTFKNFTNPSNGGLSHIIKEDNNQLIRIDDQDGMETTLHRHFAEHFSQATGTPFTEGILNTTFGYSGVNTNTEKLLDNTLHLNQPLAEMNTFLQQFKRSRPPLSDQFPTDDIINGFKKWKEKTTTSPSGLHLGIYRLIIKGLTDTDTKLVNTSTELIQIISKLIQLAIRECHTYQRWQIMLNNLGCPQRSTWIR